MTREGAPVAGPERQGSFEASQVTDWSPLVMAFENWELCDLQSPALAYAKERVGVLCGDDHEAPEVYIYSGDALNARPRAGVLLIEAATFEQLDYAEEFDALLAHELQHVWRDHACRREQLSADVEQIGSGRAGEIEADILGMQLLDRRGINPAGMVSLAEKLARAEAEELARLIRQRQTGRLEKETLLYSPTHGTGLDRKITLEQALTVIDTKHLSPDLQPMQRLSAGNTVSLRDEAFWQLPAPIQQGLLRADLKREYISVSEQHITTQMHILRTAQQAAGTPEEDESITRRKAELLLAVPKAGEHLRANDPKTMAELHTDLALLDSQEIISLTPRRDRYSGVNRIVGSTLVASVFDEATPLEVMEEAAQLTNERNVSTMGNQYDVGGGRVLGGGLMGQLCASAVLNRLTPANYTVAVEKIARFAALTRTDFDVVRSVLNEFGKEKRGEKLLSDPMLMGVTRHLTTRMHAYRMEEISRHTELIDKLAYTARMSADSHLTDYKLWGAPSQEKPTKEKMDQGQWVWGAYGESLHEAVISKTPRELRDMMFELMARGEDPKVIYATARLVYGICARDPATEGEGALNTRLYLEELDHVSNAVVRTMSAEDWEDFLPVAILASNYYHGSVDQMPDIAEIIGLSLEPRNVVYEEEDSGVKPLAEGILMRLPALRQAYEEVEQALPGQLREDFLQAAELEAKVKEARLYGVLTRFARFPGKAGSDLVSLMREQGVQRLQIGELYRSEEDLQPLNKLWCKAVDSVLSNPHWAEDEKKLLTLAGLGMASPEIEVNLAIPTRAFEQIARLRDFEGGLRLLDEFPNLRTAQAAILNVLIEEKARTADDFERLNALIEEKYTEVIADNFGLIGLGGLMDSIALPFYSRHEAQERQVGLKTDIIPAMESARLLKALLSSGHDEGPFKQYAAERWWVTKRTSGSGQEDHFRAEAYLTHRNLDPTNRPRQARLEYWLTHDYPPSGSYAPFETTMSNYYLLTGPARFAATRKLLLTDGDGVLMDSDRSKALVDALMQSWLTAQEGTEEGTVLRDMLHDLLVANDPATAYLHVGPMIQDMILKPPPEPSDLNLTTWAISNNIVDTLVSQHRLRNPTTADYQHVHTRVHRLFTGEAGQVQVSEQVEATKDRLLSAFDAKETEAGTRKLSTISFAALAGKKAGALGNKMLQLAGQYFDLDEEEEAEFSEVYDDRVGQSRLQAYNAFKREAQENEVVAQLFHSVKEFLPRVAGGSLFTVYKLILNDDREVTLGVQNPNAEYRVARLTDFAATGLAQTIDKHPTSTNLPLMFSLMHDGGRWIQGELHDPDFHSKNNLFGQQNDTRGGRGFQQGRSRYHLTTPDTLITGSQRIRSEQFINGQNLTKLKISDDQPTDIPARVIHIDDYRDAISLLVRDFVYQTSVGDVAHADIHPGNFRLTDDNSQLMVLDRYGMIPMHDRLRQTLKTAFLAIMSGDLQGAAASIATYATDDTEAIERFKAAVASTGRQSAQPAKFVADAILALKREGIQVPLDISLLLRNFMALSKLSSKARFSNLAEAFLHTSSGPEELAPLLS